MIGPDLPTALRESIALGEVQKRTDWSSEDLRAGLRSTYLLQQHFAVHPKSIEIGSMADVIGRMRAATAKTGLEHGRGLFFDLSRSTFVLGDTCVGSSSQVKIIHRLPEEHIGDSRNLVTIGTVHSHPAFLGASRWVEHVSRADFLSFIIHTRHAFGVIVMPDSALVLLKTNRTPKVTNERELGDRLDAISSKCEDRFLFKINPADIPRVYTKKVCLDFDLGLYRVSLDEPGRARAIDLLARHSGAGRTSPFDRMTHLFRLIAEWAGRIDRSGK